MTQRPSGFDESMLSAFVDDELDAATRAEVETALAESAELREVLEEVRDTRRALRDLPDVTAPPGFWDRVLATSTPAGGTSEGTVVPLAAAGRRRPVNRWSALAGAAAAAAVLGVAVIPRQQSVDPGLAELTQTHSERASLDNDVVSNLAGVVVSQDLAP